MQREWAKMLNNTVNRVVCCKSISSPNCSILIKTSLGRFKILQPFTILPPWELLISGQTQAITSLNKKAEGLSYVQCVHHVDRALGSTTACLLDECGSSQMKGKREGKALSAPCGDLVRQGEFPSSHCASLPLADMLSH